MRIISDNPIQTFDEDQYGFVPFVNILSAAIRNSSELPLSVGIFGSWGTGKSTFMSLLRTSFNDYPDIKTIWFNPWKYDQKEDLWHALIQTVLDEIEKSITGKAEKARVKELALAASWLALRKGITAISHNLLTEDNLDKLLEAIRKQDSVHYRHINQFERDFADVVKKHTGEGMLVIFIDDLDRCLPQNAITVLESLKLFMGDARCVFVLGMDHHIVQSGLKYRFEDKIIMRSRDYLDKIIQLPFYLPPVRFEKVQASLINKVTFAGNEAIFWNIVKHGMDRNPRRTKRFINSFNLLRQILNHNKSEGLPDLITAEGKTRPRVLEAEEQDMYLAKLLAFQISFPDFYEHLQRYPDDWAYLEKNVINNKKVEGKDNIDTRPRLRQIWEESEGLEKFLKETAATSYLSAPDPPSGVIVTFLQQAISLVSSAEGTAGELHRE